MRNMHAATRSMVEREEKKGKKNQKIWLIIYCTMVKVGFFMWIAARRKFFPSSLFFSLHFRALKKYSSQDLLLPIPCVLIYYHHHQKDDKFQNFFLIFNTIRRPSKLFMLIIWKLTRKFLNLTFYTFICKKACHKKKKINQVIIHNF